MRSLIHTILILLFISSCCIINCDEGCTKTYNFETHYTLTPALDSFHIGDTIWISCDFLTKLMDKDGEMVDFTDQSLKTKFNISKIDTSPYIQNYQDFTIVKKAGELVFYSLVGVAGYWLEHEITDQRFQINYGIVPLKKGLYTYGFTDDYSLRNEDPELDIDPECDEFVDEFRITLNNAGDNNFEFLKEAEDEVWRGLPKWSFDQNGRYCFYVVE